MLVPVAVAISSVAAGALLGLLPATAARALGPVRTFALTASVTAVLVHLLPEALETVGGFALLVFACALLLPQAMHALGEWMRRRALDQTGAPALALEIAYAGLLVHQIADGVGLGTYGDAAHADHGMHGHSHVHADVVVAIAAHTVPVVAAIVLGMQAVYGRRAALLRAALLAAATCLGVLLTGLVPNESMAHASGWIAAAAAGLLLHVVTHATPRVSPNFASRAADFAGAACGVALALAGGDLPEQAEGAAVQRGLGLALYELTLDSAPLLMIGFLCSALLETLNAARKQQPALSSAALTGAAAGFEPLLLAAGFLGWSFAASLWLGTLLVALVTNALGAPPAFGLRGPRSGMRAEDVSAPFSGGQAATLVDGRLEQRGPWIVLGLIAAAFAETVLARTDAPLLLWIGCLAIALLAAAYVPAAVVLGSVLVSKGVPAPLLLAALLIGPQLASAASRQATARARSVRALLAASLVGAGVAAFFWQIASVQLHAHDLGISHTYAWPSYVATALLLLLLVQKIWRVGTAAWMSELWTIPSRIKAASGHTAACGSATDS